MLEENPEGNARLTQSHSFGLFFLHKPSEFETPIFSLFNGVDKTGSARTG